MRLKKQAGKKAMHWAGIKDRLGGIKKQATRGLKWQERRQEKQA
jgi:hypothetical protein